jgi:hypothetical protein
MFQKIPPILKSIALFAVLYFSMLWIFGYVFIALGRKPGSSLNILVILITVTLVSVWFARKQRRTFSGLEYIAIVAACILIDVILQLSISFIVLGASAFTGKWSGVAFILFGHALLLGIGFLPRIVTRYVPSHA